MIVTVKASTGRTFASAIRTTGADLAAANAAFIFCYAVGTVAGPQVVGVAIDVAGDDGFAWSIAFFFGLYVALSLARMVFRPKRA